jgi:hypothetical protein
LRVGVEVVGFTLKGDEAERRKSSAGCTIGMSLVVWIERVATLVTADAAR